MIRKCARCRASLRSKVYINLDQKLSLHHSTLPSSLSFYLTHIYFLDYPSYIHSLHRPKPTQHPTLNFHNHFFLSHTSFLTHSTLLSPYSNLKEFISTASIHCLSIDTNLCFILILKGKQNIQLCHTYQSTSIPLITFPKLPETCLCFIILGVLASIYPSSLSKV